MSRNSDSPGGRLRPVRSFLLRRIPFVLGWRNIAILGAALGVLSVAVTLLLEPFGTADYEAPWRTLRLSGYALCFLLPFLALHAVDRQVYRWQGRRWWLANELVTRSMLIVAISTANWLYNIRVINDIRPSFGYWADYMISFALPGLPVLLPTGILLAWFLATRFPEPEPAARDRIRVRGEGRDERLDFAMGEFLYAEARQNYVAIHLAGPQGDDSRLLRLTLGELQQQIPGSARIHRSYLVNPGRVREVRGNARKREVVLDGVEQPLPASQRLDPQRLEIV